MSVLLHPVLAYTQVAQVARRSSTASLTNEQSLRGPEDRCGCSAKAAYCIITLADRPSQRPVWDSICGGLLPSSLCHAGRSRKVRLL